MHAARVLFSAYDAKTVQSLMVQHLPSSPPRLLLRANRTSIPDQPGHHFGGFASASFSQSGASVGLVGIGNVSQSFRTRFYGSYVLGLDNGVLHKVVDTTDSMPAQADYGKRFRTVSAPAIYSTPTAMYAIASGSDEIGGGREVIIRLALGSRQRELLLDGNTSNISGLSAPQIFDPQTPLTGIRCLAFFARRNGEPGIFTLRLTEASPSAAQRARANATASKADKLLTLLAGVRTPMPDAEPPQPFMYFGAPVVSSTLALVLFVAKGASGASGIYAAPFPIAGGGGEEGEDVRRLVDTSSGRFGAFPHAPSAAGSILVFYASVTSDPLSAGLYALDMRSAVGPRNLNRSDASGGLSGGVSGGQRANLSSTARASGMRAGAMPLAVATLRSTGLRYIIASYDGFDGDCVAFYGSSDTTDNLFTVAVPRSE